MSAILGKAGKKLFAKNLEQYAPQDPLYETYTDKKGKQKRRKRGIPPGLSQRDAKILKSIQRRAHYLDKGFKFCGLRFGWTFFIGLIPIAGDVADASLNYFLVVRKARQADLPQWLLQRMLINNAISAGVGFVPMVGDVILAMYKANSRNAALLEEFLRIRGEEFLKLNSGGEVVEAHHGNGKKKNVTRKDAEQVKPGAGMDGTVPGGLGPVTEASNGRPLLKERRKSSGASRKGFSFFGSKKSSPAEKTPADKGRFVEDIDAKGK